MARRCKYGKLKNPIGKRVCKKSPRKGKGKGRKHSRRGLGCGCGAL